MTDEPQILERRVEALEKAVKALEKKPAEITSDPREHPGLATCMCRHRKYQHNEETGCMAQADGVNCNCSCFVQRDEEPPREEPPPDGPGYTPAELFAELDRVVKGPPEIVAESWVALNRLVELRWAMSMGGFKPAVVEPTTLGLSIHRDVFGTEGK